MVPAIVRQALPARAPAARAPGSTRPATSAPDDDAVETTASNDGAASGFDGALEAMAETMRERNAILALFAEQRKRDDELLKKAIALI